MLIWSFDSPAKKHLSPLQLEKNTYRLITVSYNPLPDVDAV